MFGRTVWDDGLRIDGTTEWSFSVRMTRTGMHDNYLDYLSLVFVG